MKIKEKKRIYGENCDCTKTHCGDSNERKAHKNDSFVANMRRRWCAEQRIAFVSNEEACFVCLLFSVAVQSVMRRLEISVRWMINLHNLFLRFAVFNIFSSVALFDSSAFVHRLRIECKEITLTQKAAVVSGREGGKPNQKIFNRKPQNNSSFYGATQT